MKRRSPKAWSSKRVPYARPARSYKRSAQQKTTWALSRKRRIGSAPNTHKFTRLGASTYVLTNSVIAGTPFIAVNSDTGGGSTNPVAVGTASQMAYGANYEFGAAMQFQMNDLSGLSDFTNLFDHYEIMQVDIEIDYLKNSAAVPATPTPVGPGVTGAVSVAAMPSIIYAPDFDDATVPAQPSQLNQRQRAKVFTFRGDSKPLKFSVQPKPSTLIFKTSGTTIGYAASEAAAGPTVNLAYTDVPYYGVKLWFQDVYANQAVSGVVGDSNFRIKCKYHLKMRDPQ